MGTGPHPARRPTLVQVAEVAGVSRATVSRVVNGVESVDPDLRGNGLARTLYERFFALAEADDRSVVRAITAAQNARSIAFHTAMGFTVTPPIPHYDGDSAPKVLFERSLPAPA